MRLFLKRFIPGIRAMLEALVCHERYWETLKPTAEEVQAETMKPTAEEIQAEARRRRLEDPMQGVPLF